MHYYPETDNHIRGKVKVLLLDLSDYDTKKELEHATTCLVYVIQLLFDLNAEVDKLNELVKISNRVNNLRTEVDKLDAGKMKNITKDFKTLSDVVDKEIVEKTGYNPINTKVNKLEKKRS